jgi:hypothetical protein
MGAGRSHGPGRPRGRLAVAFGIAVVVLVLDVVGGLLSGSVALLADAAHVATDAAGTTDATGLALFAATMAARPPSLRRTFGWQRRQRTTRLLTAAQLPGIGAPEHGRRAGLSPRRWTAQSTRSSAPPAHRKVTARQSWQPPTRGGRPQQPDPVGLTSPESSASLAGRAQLELEPRTVAPALQEHPPQARFAPGQLADPGFHASPR